MRKWNRTTRKLLVLLIEGNWRHTWQWTQKNALCRADAYRLCGYILGVPKRNLFYLTAFCVIKFSITNNYFPDWRKPLAWSVKHFWSIYFFCFPPVGLILLSNCERVVVSVEPWNLTGYGFDKFVWKTDAECHIQNRAEVSLILPVKVASQTH